MKADSRSISAYGDRHPKEDLPDAIALYLATDGGILPLWNNPYDRYKNRFKRLDEMIGVKPRYRKIIANRHHSDRQYMEELKHAVTERMLNSKSRRRASRDSVGSISADSREQPE